MMKRRSKVELPEDLIEEILSRVPATSLVQFRTISKRWNALIKEESFTKKHSANAPRPSLAIMFKNSRARNSWVSLVRVVNDNVAPSANLTSQFSLKDPLSNSSKEVDIRQVFHCDGLLLCVTKDNRLVVWNPWSGESRWIRPRKFYTKYDQYALGKSSCNKYKILRMVRSCISMREIEYEVYDFSFNSWTAVYTIRDMFIDVIGGVFVKGYNYWLADHQAHHGYMLLSFDFSKEIFHGQPVLDSKFPYAVAALSVVREEKLCLLTNHGTGTIDVWMGSKSESTGVMLWSKFLTANHSYRFYQGVSFLAHEQKKVVVCCDNTEVLHIVGEDRHITVDYHGAKSSFSTLLSYVPTLVQIPHVM